MQKFKKGQIVRYGVGLTARLEAQRPDGSWNAIGFDGRPTSIPSATIMAASKDEVDAFVAELRKRKA